MIVKHRQYIEDGRLDSRAYTWFGVQVQSQKDLVAQIILQDEGFATFCLVKKAWEFSNKTTRAKMKKHEVRRPVIPGLIFIGMNERTPGWDRLFAYWVVTGVIGTDGRPVPIPHDTIPASGSLPERPGLRDLMWRHHGGEFNAPDYEKWQDTHSTFKPGDDVLTLGESMRGKVVEMDGRQADVLLSLFGREWNVTVDVAKLRAAE